MESPLNHGRWPPWSRKRCALVYQPYKTLLGTMVHLSYQKNVSILTSYVGRLCWLDLLGAGGRLASLIWPAGWLHWLLSHPWPPANRGWRERYASTRTDDRQWGQPQPRWVLLVNIFWMLIPLQVWALMCQYSLWLFGPTWQCTNEKT